MFLKPNFVYIAIEGVLLLGSNPLDNLQVGLWNLAHRFGPLVAQSHAVSSKTKTAAAQSSNT